MSLHNPERFYQSWPGAFSAMSKRHPDIAKAFGPFFMTFMKDGALDVKAKELIALAIGVAVRCESCIYLHVEKCLASGATPEEIMEATGVAVMMGGGPASTYATLVAAALDHFEAAKKVPAMA